MHMIKLSSFKQTVAFPCQRPNMNNKTPIELFNEIWETEIFSVEEPMFTQSRNVTDTWKNASNFEQNLLDRIKENWYEGLKYEVESDYKSAQEEAISEQSDPVIYSNFIKQYIKTARKKYANHPTLLEVVSDLEEHMTHIEDPDYIY